MNLVQPFPMCHGSFVCVYGSFFIPVILERVDEYLNFKAGISPS